MQQEIEIEFKILLTKDEFQRLLTDLPFPKKAITQTNYYFETDQFHLKNKRCALRIREKNRLFTATLKEPHSEGILETHDRLTENEANHWINGNIDYSKPTIRKLKQKEIPIDKLSYLGKLLTKRRNFKEGDICYFLDCNTYNGKVDYELEIESPSKKKGLRVLRQLIEAYSIKQKHTPNKIERFFQTLNL